MNSTYINGWIERMFGEDNAEEVKIELDYLNNLLNENSTGTIRQGAADALIKKVLSHIKTW